MRLTLQKPLTLIVDTVDTLYGVLVSPASTFAGVVARPGLLRPLLALLPPAVVTAFMMVPNPPQLAEVIFDFEKGTLDSIGALWIVWVGLLMPFMLLAEAVFFHGYARLAGGRGSFRGMFRGLCFAFFPWTFFAPLGLLRALIDSSTGQTLYYIGSAVLFLWIYGLQILATRENYGLSKKRAAVTSALAVSSISIFPMLGVVIWMALA